MGKKTSLITIHRIKHYNLLYKTLQVVSYTKISTASPGIPLSFHPSISISEGWKFRLENSDVVRFWKWSRSLPIASMNLGSLVTLNGGKKQGGSPQNPPKHSGLGIYIYIYTYKFAQMYASFTYAPENYKRYIKTTIYIYPQLFFLFLAQLHI